MVFWINFDYYASTPNNFSEFGYLKSFNFTPKLSTLSKFKNVIKSISPGLFFLVTKEPFTHCFNSVNWQAFLNSLLYFNKD